MKRLQIGMKRLKIGMKRLKIGMKRLQIGMKRLKIGTNLRSHLCLGSEVIASYSICSALAS